MAIKLPFENKVWMPTAHPIPRIKVDRGQSARVLCLPLLFYWPGYLTSSVLSDMPRTWSLVASVGWRWYRECCATRKLKREYELEKLQHPQRISKVHESAPLMTAAKFSKVPSEALSFLF